jgi:hypothetical protein
MFAFHKSGLSSTSSRSGRLAMASAQKQIDSAHGESPTTDAKNKVRPYRRNTMTKQPNIAWAFAKARPSSGFSKTLNTTFGNGIIKQFGEKCFWSRVSGS